MSYVDSTLLANEQVLYSARISKIIFSTTLLWLVLTLLFVVLDHLFLFMAYLTAACMLYDLIMAMARYFTSEFVLTNKRVLAKVGFIRRYSVEIFLQKVEGIQVQQSILGRIFDFGTIIICGTGGSRDRFSKIADPLQFRKRVQEQIEVVLKN